MLELPHFSSGGGERPLSLALAAESLRKVPGVFRKLSEKLQEGGDHSKFE